MKKNNSSKIVFYLPKLSYTPKNRSLQKTDSLMKNKLSMEGFIEKLYF